MTPVDWFNVIGYVYALVVPALFVGSLANRLWEIIALDAKIPRAELGGHHRSDLPFILGAIERVFYVATWNMGKPEFIGFWLALKVAGNWGAWSHGYEVTTREGEKRLVNGRHIFNTHLIGSALSAFGSVTGAIITTLLIAGADERAVLLGFGYCISLWSLDIWATRAASLAPKEAA